MAYVDPLRPEAPPAPQPIQRIALYEHDGEGVYLQADDGPVWHLVGPFPEHTFDLDAPAWLGGTWSPNEDYLRSEWEQRSGRTRGLTLVAAWTRQHGLGIVLALPGRAAAYDLGVPSSDDIPT